MLSCQSAHLTECNSSLRMPFSPQFIPWFLTSPTERSSSPISIDAAPHVYDPGSSYRENNVPGWLEGAFLNHIHILFSLFLMAIVAPLTDSHSATLEIPFWWQQVKFDSVRQRLRWLRRRQAEWVCTLFTKDVFVGKSGTSLQATRPMPWMCMGFWLMYVGDGWQLAVVY